MTRFEINIRSDLIYIHSYTSEIGHTCAAVEPAALHQLIDQLNDALSEIARPAMDAYFQANRIVPP